MTPQERIARLRELVEDRKLPWGTRRSENGVAITEYVAAAPFLIEVAEAALRVVDELTNPLQEPEIDALRERLYESDKRTSRE